MRIYFKIKKNLAFDNHIKLYSEFKVFGGFLENFGLDINLWIQNLQDNFLHTGNIKDRVMIEDYKIRTK